MSPTTFLARRATGHPSNARAQAAAAATKRAGWLHFANHMATWATGGRLPLSE
ncbi:hypothetical protein [Variovorax sp. YR566]|uniref:hypothetical protein n=1 Tax=Variovorax sp. YR566 TaxID=3450237 RepID=UPI003F807627